MGNWEASHRFIAIDGKGKGDGARTRTMEVASLPFSRSQAHCDITQTHTQNTDTRNANHFHNGNSKFRFCFAWKTMIYSTNRRYITSSFSLVSSDLMCHRRGLCGLALVWMKLYCKLHTRHTTCRCVSDIIILIIILFINYDFSAMHSTFTVRRHNDELCVCVCGAHRRPDILYETSDYTIQWMRNGM